MEKLAKSKSQNAYKFKKVVRFLDDMAMINTDSIMENEGYINTIYPSQLKLTIENNDDQKCSFLDMSLWIIDNKIDYKLYDKRDDFPFDIVSYPDLSGNICSTNAYGVFIGQLLRFSKTCNNYSHSVQRTHLLIQKLIKQNFKQKPLLTRCRKFYERHFDHIKKYNKFQEDFVKDLFSY